MATPEIVASSPARPSLPAEGRPLEDFVVETRGSGDGMELAGASIDEDALGELLRQPGVIHARNQHGAVVEMFMDMDGDTPVVRPVASYPIGALSALTPFPSERSQDSASGEAPAGGDAAGAELVAAWRCALAGDPASRQLVAAEHPALARAFALDASVRAFAEQSLQPPSRGHFLDLMRQRIEHDLAAGHPLPEVQLRDARALAQGQVER